MGILEEWHEENVERIIRVLKEYKDEFHGGDEVLFEIAEEIIDVLPLEVY